MPVCEMCAGPRPALPPDALPRHEEGAAKRAATAEEELYWMERGSGAARAELDRVAAGSGPPAGGDGDGGDVPLPPGGWACSVCTYVNEGASWLQVGVRLNSHARPSRLAGVRQGMAL